MSDQQGWTPPGGDGDALRDVPLAATSDPTADTGWAPTPPTGWEAPSPSADAPSTQAPLSPPPPPPPPGQSHPVPPGPGSPPSVGPQGAPGAFGHPAGARPPGWTPPQLAPKPGIIPLRPLTLGEIWGGVMTAIRGNPAATIGLALVTTAVVLVPLTLIGLWVASSTSGPAGMEPPFDPNFDPAVDGSGDSSAFTAAFLGSGALASMVPALATYVTALLLPLFMAVVVGQGVQGRRIGLGETARAARGRIVPVLGVVLLAGLAAALLLGLLVGGVAAAWATTGSGDGGGAGLVTFVAAVVGVVAFVLFSVRWAFAVTIVVLEGARPVQALRRSWQLTRKRGFWRIFGIRLLTGIVTGIVGSVITAPVAFVVGMVAGSSLTSTAWMLVLTQALSVLVQSVLTTPFSSGVDSLLYVDQRIRYEGLDMALLQQAKPGHDAPVT